MWKIWLFGNREEEGEIEKDREPQRNRETERPQRDTEKACKV